MMTTSTIQQSTTTTVARAAVYGRYSCDKQRETSIEDQIRRCRALAEKHGLQVDESLIFCDSAISGQGYATAQREGFQQLLSAWDAGKFQVLLVDEFERLTRDDVEAAILRQRLRDNRQVRLLTSDGTDTNVAGWDLTLGIKGALAQDELRKIRHRVGRGMVGQLERGYMVACPAYGYNMKRVYDEAGNKLGTQWLVNEKEAEIVVQIFKRRAGGQSMRLIARWLNDSAIPTRRAAKIANGGFWRASAVKNVLANPVYKGQFIWHGSHPYKSRARKRGERVEEKVFYRPHLRLVEDEVWERCNERKISRTAYGGGKNVLAGVIECGHCGAILVLSALSRCQSVYCASCTSEKSSNGNSARQTVSVAVRGVEQLLQVALRNFLSPTLVTEFKESLREKLTGGVRREYDTCQSELKRLMKVQNRLSRMLAEVDDDDPVLVARYEETRRLVRVAEKQLDDLSKDCCAIDASAVDAQLQVDPSTLLDQFFALEMPVEQKRALLASLFPRIVLEGKDSKYTSRFRICFSPGAALAYSSGTPELSNSVVSRLFRLKYGTGHRGGRGGTWSVTVVEESTSES